MRRLEPWDLRGRRERVFFESGDGEDKEAKQEASFCL